MKINYIRVSTFILIAFGTGCATNGGGESTVGLATVEQATPTGRPAIESGATAKGIEENQASLTNTLVNQLGVSQQQALGGAGAIFQTAKGNMEPQAFSTLSQSVPGMNEMLNAAPKISNGMSNMTGGISSMMGNANNTLGSMASLVSSFKKLGLSPNMVNQFVPVVTNYVRTNGGQVMANLLQSALSTP